MKTTEKIILDLSLQELPYTVQAKQGDVNTRYIECTIIDNQQDSTIDGATSAMYSLRKPDGTQIVNKATIKNNQVIIVLTAQCLTVAGRCPCEVTFYDRDKNQLSSITFYVNVQPAVFEKNLVASSSEYNILLDAIEDATSAANAANTAAGRANTATVNANTAASNAISRVNQAINEANEQIQDTVDRVNDQISQVVNETQEVKESTIEVRDETRQALNELKRDNNQYANALSKEVKGTQIKVEDAREKALFEQIKLNGKTTVIKANQEERISPDNPAEISGIGQSNTIDLIVATRNLCYVSLEDMTTTANGVTVKYTGENQQIQLNGTISKVGFCMRSKVIPISVEEGEQFKFWLESISGGYSANSLGCFSVEFLNKEGQKIIDFLVGDK